MNTNHSLYFQRRRQAPDTAGFSSQFQISDDIYYIYYMQASGEDLPLKYKKVPMSEAQWMNLLVPGGPGACPSTALDLFIFNHIYSYHAVRR